MAKKKRDELPLIYSDDSFEVKVAKMLQRAEMDPEGRSGHYRELFFTHLMEKQYDKAWDYIRLAIVCCIDKAEQAENYGCVNLWYGWQDRNAEGIEWAVKSVELDPEPLEGLVQLGWSYMEEEDYTNAMLIFDRVLTMPKDEEDTINDWQEMVYQEMIKEFGEDANAKKINKFYNKLLKDASTDKERAVIHSLLGMATATLGNIKDGIANEKKAVALNPGCYMFVLKLGELLIKDGKFEEAKNEYAKLLEIGKANSGAGNYYSRLYNDYMGQLYVEQNKFDEALQFYIDRVKLHEDEKDSFSSYERISGILLNQRRYKEAMPYLQKIIEIWPNLHPRAYTSMATVYFREENDPENALNYLFLAAKANYMDDSFMKGNDHEIAGVIYSFIGEIYYRSYNDTEKGIEYYEKALECKPEKALEGEICDGLYDIYIGRGDDEKANEYKDRRSAKNTILDLFGGNWTPPPLKTLDERLRNPQNKPEEIKKLPYHHSKIPKGTVEKHDFLKKLRYEFEEDLLKNKKYQDYFAAYEPFYVRDFIHKYVNHKVDLLEWHKWYEDPEEGLHEIILKESTAHVFEILLQKKLFNMQLQWRANEIKIKEIKTSHDFITWSRNIFECPFIEITRNEVALLIEYVLSPDFTTDANFCLNWQDYNLLQEEPEVNEEGESSTNMPYWYEYYDNAMNTGSLLLLPNTRGEMEEKYLSTYYEWKRKQPPEPKPPHQPYKAGLKYIYGTDEEFTEFMEQFENDYFCNFHQNWLMQKQYPDKDYDRIAVMDAISELEYADEKVIMEGGLPWNEALIKCANLYKNKKIASKLYEAFEEYMMKRQLNIIQREDGDLSGFWDKHTEDMRNYILKGRELLNEPRDLDF